MKPSFGTQHFFIALLLLVFIPSPRLLEGLARLETARKEATAGNYAYAASSYTDAAGHLPWYCPVFGETGTAYHEAGLQADAATFFSKGEACHGLSLDQWLAYGDSLAALGDLGAAVRVWKLALIHNGVSHEVFNRLAMAARQMGNLYLAIDLYQRAVNLAPEEAEAWYQLGLLLTAVDPARALPYLMEVNRLDPDRETDIRPIRLEINRALLEEDPAYQYTLTGRLLGSLHEWDLAIEAFERALSFNSNYAEALAWLAEAKQASGEDGRVDMERALALDPESPGIHGLDGLIWMQMGNPENALSSFEKAAALEPENAIWQISLGDASASAGEFNHALQYYYRAVVLSPDDPSTWRALAQFSLDNDIDVAHTGLAASEGLSQLAPDDWFSFLIAGRVSLMLDNQISARTNLLKAIEAAPQEPAPHYYLGLSFLEGRMYTLAYDKLMDVTHLDPTGMYAWKAQRLLEVYFP